MDLNKFKYIAFDADDTLWVNETYFRDTEKKFFHLLKDFISEDQLIKELYHTEIQNIEIYGYGIKGFVLSMIETAWRVSQNKIQPTVVKKIIDLGKEMLNKPVELLPGVKDALKELSAKHKLIVATKGDLLDQERKLEKSGLANCFHHIEVMSEKKTENYQKLIQHLDIDTKDFLMIGNSVKSDILPVLELGGFAIHIPFHTTWIHEQEEVEINNNGRFVKLEKIQDLLFLY